MVIVLEAKGVAVSITLLLESITDSLSIFISNTRPIVVIIVIKSLIIVSDS